MSSYNKKSVLFISVLVLFIFKENFGELSKKIGQLWEKLDLDKKKVSFLAEKSNVYCFLSHLLPSYI